MKERIRAKALLGFPLTERERAMFLLFIATNEEVKDFLERESMVKTALANFGRALEGMKC